MVSPPDPATGPGGIRDPGSLAVIGAGAAGCACVAALRRQGWAGPISLWESGRGPGGRTATRRSRTDAGLRIDHGAPLFNLTTSPPPALLEPLLAGGWIEPWTGPIAQLDGQGQLHPGGSAPHGLGSLYRGNGEWNTSVAVCWSKPELTWRFTTASWYAIWRSPRSGAGACWARIASCSRRWTGWC